MTRKLFVPASVCGAMRTRVSFAVFASSLLVLAIASATGCSGASNAFVDGADGGTGANGGPASDDDQSSDGGMARDAKAKTDGARDGSGSGDDGTDDDADTTPPPPTKVGQIYVGETITLIQGQEYDSSYATAMFFERSPSAGPSCTTSHFGACTVYDCPLGGATQDAGTPRYAGAGTVHITGGYVDYTLDTKAGSYVTQSTQSLLYDQGTVLRVSATGDEVPAFSNKTLTVPGPFDVTSPDLSSSLALSRAHDLAVAWTGASGRDVQVSVSTIQQNVRSVSIACTFSGSSASANVPAAAMAKLLKANGSSITGALAISAPVQTTFSAGSWLITFGLTPGAASSTFTTTN